jgi:hypothetical protein
MIFRQKPDFTKKESTAKKYRFISKKPQKYGFITNTPKRVHI